MYYPPQAITWKKLSNGGYDLLKEKNSHVCEIPNDASSVLQAEWLVLENNGKPTLNINKRYLKISSTREWYLHAMNLRVLAPMF